MSLLDWIYPPVCSACQTLLPIQNKKQIAILLCEACEGIPLPIVPPVCDCCGAPLETEVPLCASCFGKHFHFPRTVRFLFTKA